MANGIINPFENPFELVAEEEDKKRRLEEFLRQQGREERQLQEDEARAQDEAEAAQAAQAAALNAPSGEFDRVIPDAPAVAETVGGGTPIDDVISWLRMTPEQQMLENRPRALEARGRESAMESGIKTEARLAEKNRMIEKALKEHPMPSKWEQMLAFLTGGLSGAVGGTFSREKKSRDARAAIEKSFPEEWERIQDALVASKAAAVRATVASGTQSYNATKAYLEGLAMSGGVSIPEGKLSGFGVREAGNLRTEFEGFKHDWATADNADRRTLYLGSLEKKARLSLYKTWLTMTPPPPGIGVTMEDATQAWEAGRGGQEVEHLKPELERGAIGAEVTEDFTNDIESRVAQLHGVDVTDEKMELIAGPIIDAIKTTAAGTAKIKELDEAAGNQAYLVWLGDENTPMMSPEKKAAIRSFRDSEGWADPVGLAKMVKDLKLEEPTLDAMERNAARITGLRDELSKKTVGTPGFEKAKEALDIGLALSSSGYVITTEKDKDGNIVFKAERTGKARDPYSLTVTPVLNGYMVSAQIDPAIIKSGDKKEIAEAQRLAMKGAELMAATSQSTMFIGKTGEKIKAERTKEEIQKEFNEYMKGLENEDKRDLVKDVMRKQARGEEMSGEEIKLLIELIKLRFID